MLVSAHREINISLSANTFLSWNDTTKKTIQDVIPRWDTVNR
jgi:hypothetical protein